jgi:hypothetical protein
VGVDELTKRVAVVQSGFIQDVLPNRVAVNGVIEEVGRALVVKDGIAREFFPPDDVDPNQIFWTTTPAAGNDIEIAPTTAQVFIQMVVASGEGYVTIDGVTTFIEYFLRPPTTSVGQFLIRCDVVAGAVLGDTTGAWLDIHVSGPGKVWSWYVEQASTGVEEATVDISISQDSGGGVPDAGTTVVKRITLRAEQVADALRWSTAQWDLEEITINDVADCELRFETEGQAFGEADTSGNETEDWADGPQPTYTVQADLISGTAPAGPALGAPHTLDVNRAWILTALDGEDLSCELDVTVDGGAAGSSLKTVTMHSMRTDTDSSVVWPTTQVDIVESVPGEPVMVALVSKITGVGSFQVQTGSIPDEDWHSDAPSPLDQTDYEVRLRVVSGDGPNNGIDGTGAWINAGLQRTWRWRILTGAGIQNLTGVVEWGYRRVGEISTEVLKIVTLDLTGGS